MFNFLSTMSDGTDRKYTEIWRMRQLHYCKSESQGLIQCEPYLKDPTREDAYPNKLITEYQNESRIPLSSQDITHSLTNFLDSWSTSLTNSHSRSQILLSLLCVNSLNTWLGPCINSHIVIGPRYSINVTHKSQKIHTLVFKRNASSIHCLVIT